MAKNNHHKNGNKRKTDIIEHLYQEKVNDLKKKSITSKENKEAYKKEYDQIKAHIDEMREVALKKEIRNNSVITVILVIVVFIFLFMSIGAIRYSINTKKQSTNNIVASENNETNITTEENDDVSKKDDLNGQSSNKSDDNETDVTEESSFSDKVYEYLTSEDNREKMLELSISQNNNKNTGMNLIFLSNILNENGVNLSKNIINNAAFKEELEKNGFKKYTNPNELKEGDIVFTIDGKDTPGVPTHVYIFMGWSDTTKRVGYVVDGQVSIYNKTYHKRAITVQAPTTDKMQFFMRKE